MAWPIASMLMYASQLGYLLAFALFSTYVEAHSFFPKNLVGFQVSHQTDYDCKTAFQAQQPTGKGASAPSSAVIRVGLVHRYGHCSPLKLNQSRSAILEEMIKRESMGSRIQFMKSKLGEAPNNMTSGASIKTPISSGESIGTGNYIMTVGLGTPSKQLIFVIDTGSDVAWTQCLPCSACYNQTDSFFDPAASSSYQPVACLSLECDLLTGASSANGCSNGTCEYRIKYLDGSNTTGDFATDALAVGGTTVASSFAFGCGHDNEGLFQGFDGLLGLSKSPLGFPAQTKALFGQVFAYCLPSPFSSSPGFIEFGTSRGAGGNSTLLVPGTSPSVYFVQLLTVTVGTSAPIIPLIGSMVVDSGTIITRLDSSLYTQVRDAFRNATASLPSAPSSAGLGLFDTCYSLQVGSTVELPAITLTFLNGVDFAPSSDSLLYPVANGTYCLAFAPIQSSSGLSILGNYQQQGYLFSFNIPLSTLGIEPGAC